MDIRTNVLIGYVILGLILIIFNKQINNLYYKFVLFYTDKLNLSDLFVFKVNNRNKGSLMLYSRIFMIVFGIIIVLFSLYALFA